MSPDHHSQPRDLRIGHDVARGRRIRFRVDGRAIDACEGESVAAALWAAGVRSLDEDPMAPPSRTLFCAMGNCQQCAMWIDGRRTETCLTPARDGLDVRTQLASEAGAANHRSPIPEAAADVTIVGAGPAGVAAAVQAAELGLRVVLLDENAFAGGQVHRVAPGIAPAPPDRDRIEGDALRASLDRANVDKRFGHRVWHVERVHDRWRVHAVAPDGATSIQSAALIAATGAQERFVPFDGWHRPGVIGLAAATLLLKAQRVLPGRAVLVAGSGPLLLLVAKSILEGGGRVVAVVDAQPKWAWRADVAALASRPDLVARGIGWMRTLRKHRLRMLHAHVLRSISGTAPELRAVVTPIDRDGPSVELDCDAVCCGFGLMPATELTRLAGASHAFDATRGGWHARVDDDQRCDVPLLYVAGDGGGVAGAAAAPWQGRIAALRVARDLGRIDASAHEARAASAKQARHRASRFGAAMTRLASAGDGVLASIAGSVTVCQCEGLTRATLDAAIDDGATTINDLKAATRCGMGSCGGRLCEDAAARLIALRTGATRTQIGQATGRPPLRPVDLDTLAGQFDYEALPIASPSPL